jgi:ribosomal protein S18 acetylase RimI-like enzyme
MTPDIRLATIDEASLVHRIMQAAFAEYIGVLDPPSGANRETVADVEQAMSQGGAVLGYVDQTPVGSGRFRLEPNFLYIGRMAVLPEQRGAGIGRAMMDFMEHVAAERHLAEVHLGVRMTLPQNLSFYEKLGYSVLEIGTHPKGGDQVATLVKRLKVTS